MQVSDEINLCFSCTYTKLVFESVYNQIILVTRSEHSVLGAGTYKMVVYVKNRRKINKCQYDSFIFCRQLFFCFSFLRYNDDKHDALEIGALYVVPVHKPINFYICMESLDRVI